ncbi:MAG: Unknown protein [uncultured Sulfurovum sp.]|uniref:DUF234 domain-containing protein n=1 Tax=uncultured Sulfurovum sp. TaxID=269237 RepID=A0A6S6TZX3_9BACT|nr:MAG: Unknown protein [uncultured Sulfurovum sp.]
MAKHPTLLQHFRSFVYQNKITDFEKGLAYFTVFGGTGWDVDSSKDVASLIEEKVLRNYESLHKSMTRYTHNNPVYHKILSLIALGTEHEHDVFKQAKVGKDRGEEAIDYLENKSLLKFDLSFEQPFHEHDKKSDRLLFTLPFMRFWFAMISPNYKNIASGDFLEFKDKWKSVSENFSIVLSNQLVLEFVKEHLTKQDEKDPVVSIGTYYDKAVQLHILAKRESGKLVAGACKYANSEAKINMIEMLKQKCEKVKLEVNEYVLFSKNGFTQELKDCDEKPTLLTQKELSALLKDISKKDLLTYTNRKY